MLFPAVITVIADSLVALSRISKFLTAEELAEPYELSPNSDYAIDVEGDFKWETTHKPGSYTPNPRRKTKSTQEGARKPKPNSGINRVFHRRKQGAEQTLPTNVTGSVYPNEKDNEKRSQDSEIEKPFELTNIKMQVPKGAFVAVVGRVGSGKASNRYFTEAVLSI